MFNIVILAGGLGKRMKSDIPKVLHEVGGIPMLVRVITQAKKLNPKSILIVVGKYKIIIKETLSKYFDVNEFVFINQEPALGTGHALQCCVEYLKNENENSEVLILSGDAPLITSETMKNMYENDGKIDVRIMTTILEEPCGNGRIIKDNNNEFERIVEEKDCNDIERKIQEVNCGIYVFRNKLLCENLRYLDNNNAQKEYYLTDMVKILKDNVNANIDIYVLPKDIQWQLTNVNTKEQKEKLNEFLLNNK